MSYSIKILRELKLKPACNIELSFTCDEESGGIDGTGYLVNQKLIKPDYALVMDGNDRIANAHKGVLALEITVIGKSCHAAWPQRGINAFIGGCKLSEKLNELNQKLSKIKSKCNTRETIEKSPTLVLGGVVKGGSKFNTLPGEFSFTIDRRIIPEENIKDAKKQIEEIIDKFKKTNPEYGIKIKTLLEAEPAFTDENSKISKILFNSIKNIKGHKPEFSLLPGFLDMRFFINDAKIPCVSYSVSGNNAHGDDEFVYISTIFENIRILCSVILDKELGL
ncbi:MAG: M20/M25/M40 family metallo-hydrolase [Candidatus Aenigmarchaeota archaeon]|nr:M20/M25/M40 family metallo-hydrolase [Candidatus Aenigmarchaeota archaeon]